MKKLNISLFVAALIGLTSCLKDGAVNLGPGAAVSPPVVQWSTANIDDAPVTGATVAFRTYSRAYPTAATSVNLALQVNLTGSEAAPSDITVGLGVNLTAYAVITGVSATIPILPAAAYTLPATVTILKGQRNAAVNITLNTTLLDPTKTYDLPVQITSTNYGDVSANYGTVIYQLMPANKYDGAYTYANGSASSLMPGLTVANAPLATQLVAIATSGITVANTVYTTFLETPAYQSNILYTFNTTTNVMTGISIPNFFTVTAIDPVSGYNPVTKVIRAKFTAGTYSFDETYTYTGPRPSTN